MLTCGHLWLTSKKPFGRFGPFAFAAFGSLVSKVVVVFFLGDEKHWKPRNSNFEFRAHHPPTESGLFSSIESKSNKRY